MARTFGDLLPGIVLAGPLVPEITGESTFASVRGYGGVLSAIDIVTYNDAVDGVVADYFRSKDKVQALVGCTPAAVTDPCVTDFVRRFGGSAFRRRLGKEEIDRYVAVVRLVAEDTGSVITGLELAVTALLEAPSFFYLVEIGETDPRQPDTLRLTGFEIAARLSYSLWQTTPDAALLDAAEARELQGGAGLRRSIDRLLRDSRSKEGTLTLFREYLSLDDLPGLQRDRALFPKADPALFRSMGKEIELLVEEFATVPGRSVMGLLDTRVVHMNSALGALYGLTVPNDGAHHRVELPELHSRQGLLTRAGFLAPRGSPLTSSPTMRGVFIFQHLLCEAIPGEVPANVEQLLEKLRQDNKGKTLTERQLREMHGSLPGCSTCHQLFDPIGFALENFDAIGAYRSTDKGQPVDASGSVVTQRDAALDPTAFTAVDGPAALGRLLAKDPRVPDCLSRQAYRFLTGHLENAWEGREVLPAISRQFERSGYDFTDLMATILMSDGFLRASRPL